LDFLGFLGFFGFFNSVSFFCFVEELTKDVLLFFF
jgi:hypothetical protein